MSINNIKPNFKKAIFYTKKQLPDFVSDAMNLEGIAVTVPEVQTLLEGISIGGHKQSDITITNNQIEAWKSLFNSLEENKFEVSKSFTCKLHSIAAKEESLTWGHFRNAAVSISGTNYKPPIYNTLDDRWNSMLNDFHNISDIFEKASFVFLTMAKNQFFFDVNKRMGRFMMNSILLYHGYPAINVQAKRKQEFNQLMIEYYESNNMQDMRQFLLSCIPTELIDVMSK